MQTPLTLILQFQDKDHGNHFIDHPIQGNLTSEIKSDTSASDCIPALNWNKAFSFTATTTSYPSLFMAICNHNVSNMMKVYLDPKQAQLTIFTSAYPFYPNGLH